LKKTGRFIFSRRLYRGGGGQDGRTFLSITQTNMVGYFSNLYSGMVHQI